MTGFFETLGAGWIFGIDKAVATLGPAVVFTYMFTHFGSIIIACGLWFGLNSDNQVWGGFLGLFLCFFTGIAVTGWLLSQKMNEEPGKWTWSSIIYQLTLGNVMELRAELSSVVGYLPWIWAFALKNIIPQILLILFINLAQSKNADGDSVFGHYGGYVTWPYQVLGILVVCFAGIFVLVGFAAPKIFEDADIPYKAAKQAAEEKNGQPEDTAVADGDVEAKNAKLDDSIVEEVEA